MVDQCIITAFQTMWGPFPEPVMLIHKSGTILAVNDFARQLGSAAGIKCQSVKSKIAPGAGECSICPGHQALDSGKSVCAESLRNGHHIINYWVPVPNVPGVCVHFGAGTAALLDSLENALPEA